MWTAFSLAVVDRQRGPARDGAEQRAAGHEDFQRGISEPTQLCLQRDVLHRFLAANQYGSHGEAAPPVNGASLAMNLRGTLGFYFRINDRRRVQPGRGQHMFIAVHNFCSSQYLYSSPFL